MIEILNKKIDFPKLLIVVIGLIVLNFIIYEIVNM
jgi:hypothetical protein